jgi:hypothetical protein
MDVELFLDAEKEYFLPMIERATRYSLDELDRFRLETVRERKERVSMETFELCRGVVVSGPFTGMRLTSNPWWGGNDLGSMCLGLYELEVLNCIIESSSERENFVDIGAADGYYAVGGLYCGSFKKSLAFEISEFGRSTILDNWKTNGSPGEISVFGDVFRDFERALSEVDLSRSVVLIDIEGFEFDLLNKDRLKFLKDAIIIIEVHNWIEDFFEKYSSFLRNAHEYFDISIIENVDRSLSGFPFLRSFTDDNRFLLLSESRQCVMRFLKLESRR